MRDDELNQWLDRLTPQDVSRWHRKDDVDARPESHHHTLGLSENQAMPGGILKNLILPLSASGSYSQADFQSVLNALAKMQGTL